MGNLYSRTALHIYSIALDYILMKSPHDPLEWFPAARAAKLSGLTAAMVNYLCRTAIVEPSCTCPRGHGIRRHYSFGDLVALRLVARLSSAGVSPLRLRKAMQAMRAFHPAITLKSLPARHIVTDGVDLYLRHDGEALERLGDGQMAFAFVIELSQLRDEVAAAIAHAA